MLDLEIKVAALPEAKDKAEDSAKSVAETAEAAVADDFPEIGIKAVFDDVNQEFLIVDVVKGSDAEAKGINIGDKFKTVNNRKIFGVEDLRIKIKESMPEGQISLQFIGEDMLDVITLKLKENDEQN
jgi:S1-C subfamily serine protease